MDDNDSSRPEPYDIGVSSGLIHMAARNAPQTRRNGAGAFSSLQVELPSRRWLKLAAGGKGSFPAG